MSDKKDYLGDGLYIDTDGFGISLTAENGVEVLERVYLEPGVFRALLRYTDRVLGWKHEA